MKGIQPGYPIIRFGAPEQEGDGRLSVRISQAERLCCAVIDEKLEITNIILLVL